MGSYFLNMGVTRACFNGLGNLHSVIMRLTKFVMGLVITGFVRCRILEETPSSPVAFLNPILSKYLDTLPSFTAEKLNSPSGRVIFALIA